MQPIDAALQNRPKNPHFENVRAKDPTLHRQLSPGFHPDALAEADTSSVALAKGRAALAACWTVHERIVTTAIQVDNKAKLATAVEPEIARAVKYLKEEIAGLDRQWAHHDAEVKREVGNGTFPLAAEIRAHCKALPPAESQRFLHEQVKAGNRDAVKAIIAAPSWLSGLEEDEVYFESVNMAHELLAPNHAIERRNAAKAAETARKLLDEFGGAWSRSLRYWKSSDDQKVSDLLKTLKKDDAA